jgi:hypothetical protein
MSSTSCTHHMGKPLALDVVAAARDHSHVLDYREKVQSVCSVWVWSIILFEVALDFATAPPNVQHMHMRGACSIVAPRYL